MKRIVVIGRSVSNAVECSAASDVGRGGDSILLVGRERAVSSRDFLGAVGGPVDGQAAEVSPDGAVGVFFGADGGVYQRPELGAVEFENRDGCLERVEPAYFADGDVASQWWAIADATGVDDTNVGVDRPAGRGGDEPGDLRGAVVTGLPIPWNGRLDVGDDVIEARTFAEVTDLVADRGIGSPVGDTAGGSLSTYRGRCH